MRRIPLALLGLVLMGATPLHISPPSAHWHFSADYALIPPPDAPDDPDAHEPVAPPMLAGPDWAPPRLFGQSAGEVRTDILTLPTPAAGPFSVELWLDDHVNRPVGALVGGTTAEGSLAWSLAYLSALGNGKFAQGAALQFGPIALQPEANGKALAPWRAYLHHLVGTFDGTRWRLYHNGALVGEAAGGPAPFARLHLAGYLGLEPGMRLADLLRDLTLHGHALSADAVKAAFAARQAEIIHATRGSEPGLRFTAGPYLTPPGSTEQKLLWETNERATARLDWGTSAAFDHHLDFPADDRLHRVTLGPLQPDTVYFYRVTAAHPDGSKADSGMLAFRTLPRPGDPLVLALLGDTQERPYINRRLARLIWQERPHALLIAGDLIGGEEDERRWHWTDEYFVGMGPLVARVPVLAARGNGDIDLADVASDKRLFTNFDRYHNQPDLDTGGTHRGYYSYRMGDAEIFVLDGNLKLRGRQEPGFRARQRAWLETALARSTAPWKIAMHHQPAYSSDEDDYGDAYAGPTTGGDPEIRKDFVDLYERHGVGLVLSGHIHSYERSWPLIGGRPACGGITYVQLGGGGGDHERAQPAHGATAAALWSGFHMVMARLWGDRLELRMIDGEGRLRDIATLEPRGPAAERCASPSAAVVTK